MPYARQNYSMSEITTMLKGAVNTSVSAGGGGGAAPNPHASIHAPMDELHQNKLFQKARVTTGDVGKHSVVKDTDEMAKNLCKAMNSAAMQAHLALLDPPPKREVDPSWHPKRQEAVQSQNTQSARNPKPKKTDIWVNINFDKPQGVVDAFEQGGASVSSSSHRYQCLGVKLMANPNNRDIPILQTCVPKESTSSAPLFITVT
ncbi:MAG: hypothetical protein V2I48_08090 [Xanthomonadales bacterium]|jgi:hypothetical protein|nr:hypothetical protein [Xanthomonadales bacterium]